MKAESGSRAQGLGGLFTLHQLAILTAILGLLTNAGRYVRSIGIAISHVTPSFNSAVVR
jgi:hypothetical protein